MQKSIAVIIPAYNRPEELDRALTSVGCQTLLPQEVIVCDDGSKIDLTLTIEKHKDKLNIVYVRINNSGGPSKPRNIAAQLATSKWLAFLDSDDEWHPNKLKVLSIHLNADNDVVYHKLKVNGSKSNFNRIRTIGAKLNINADPYYSLLTTGNPIPMSSAVVSSELYRSLNGMEIDSYVVEDYDFWIRAAKNNAKFKFINDVLGNYYIMNNSQSSRYEFQAELLNRCIEMHERNFSACKRRHITAFRHYNSAIQLISAKKYSMALMKLHHSKELITFRQKIGRIKNIMYCLIKDRIS